MTNYLRTIRNLYAAIYQSARIPFYLPSNTCNDKQMEESVGFFSVCMSIILSIIQTCFFFFFCLLLSFCRPMNLVEEVGLKLISTIFFRVYTFQFLSEKLSASIIVSLQQCQHISYKSYCSCIYISCKNSFSVENLHLSSTCALQKQEFRGVCVCVSPFFCSKSEEYG